MTLPCRVSEILGSRPPRSCARGGELRARRPQSQPFVGGEDALLAAAVSATGYMRGTRAVRAEKRAKASVKGSGSDVTPAG